MARIFYESLIIYRNSKAYINYFVHVIGVSQAPHRRELYYFHAFNREISILL